MGILTPHITMPLGLGLGRGDILKSSGVSPIADIITSAINDTAGTHTGQLWVSDEDSVYRLTPSGQPNIQGGAWDGTKLIAPTTYPTRGIRTQKGTRYPTTDVNFRGLTCAPSITNKCTCRKTNPTDTTNVTKGGDAAATLTVVDDTAALTAAGLINICTSGKVYKLDNSGGVGSAWATISGTVGNTNVHSFGAFVKKSGGSTCSLEFGGGGSATQFSNSTWGRVKAENKTPVDPSKSLAVSVSPGAICYFILPELIEASSLDAPCVPPNAAADALAAYTRPATYATYSTAGNLFPMVSATEAQNFAIAMRVVPLRAGQASAWMLSSYVDANNYTGILVTATQVILRKRFAGVDTDTTLTYTHVANTPFWIAAVLSGQGMSAKVKQDGGAWSSWADVTTAAGQAASPIASTYQLSALNNSSGFAANYPIGPQIIHLGNHDTLDEYKAVAEAKLAEILI